MPVRCLVLALTLTACAWLPAVAAGAVEFGQSMALTPAAPDGGAGPCPAGARSCAVALVRDAAGGAAGAPAEGVLVRVRVRARTGADGTFTPRALRPRGDGTFVPVGDGTPFALDGSGDVLTVPTRIRVRAGDVLALRGTALPGAFDGDASAGAVAVFGETEAWEVGGAPRAPDAGAPAPGDLIVAGVLEADADGDGYGDESQDACALDGARPTPCEVDLAVAVAAPGFGVQGQAFDHAFSVRNAGPSPAADVAIRLAPVSGGDLRGVAAPGACVVDGAGLRCAVGRVDPGDEVLVRLTLAGAAGAVVRTAATVSSPVPDRAPGDESASAATTITAPSVAPPGRPFVPVACANVVRGTGDDELLSGTGFGDRLLGGAGRDLIRGAGGDDCLEGGSGGDVLDGEAGDDRLAGGDGHDRLRGGPGDDSLRGGLRDDALIGGPGRDALVGGVGKDRFDAGTGNDSVDARDGVRESVDCGRGLDVARVDRHDRLRGCERVRRR